MRRFAQAVVIGATALGPLIGTAGTASADDRSFLDLVHANGMPDRYGFFGNVGDSGTLMLGHRTCDGIRAGMPANQAMPQLTWDTEHLRPMLIDAAQHELCPDTLPH